MLMNVDACMHYAFRQSQKHDGYTIAVKFVIEINDVCDKYRKRRLNEWL